jgi:hypothetical protein
MFSPLPKLCFEGRKGERKKEIERKCDFFLDN